MGGTKQLGEDGEMMALNSPHFALEDSQKQAVKSTVAADGTL
jgi:hypothetical protein